MKTVQTKTSGFNLTELVVVLVAAGLLMAVALPAMERMKIDQGQVLCLENLDKIGTALSQYSQDNSGDLLPCNMGEKKTTWFFLLKPYLSRNETYNENTAVFQCPADLSPYKGNANAPLCPFSYGYNNSAGDGVRLKKYPDEWYYQYPKKLDQVPPETALITEIKNKNDWMEWFVSDTSAKEGMLFPHQNEDGPAANILFIEGNVMNYSKYAMESIHQWKIWKRK